MKENTLDVLFYLFDNYPEIDETHSEDRGAMDAYLKRAGFFAGEIDRAFAWLESLGDSSHAIDETYHETSLRFFSPREQRWLDAECQGYLLFLEQSGILRPETREQVLDRVLELEDEDFNLNRLKWVLFVVLLNRPDESAATLWTEGLSLDGNKPTYH